jgi:hypothetical protein
MEPSDRPAAMLRALTVLREWDHSDMSLARHEAESIIERDGDHEQLLTGLIDTAGFLLVNLEQRGQPASTTLKLVEAFARSQGEGA